VGASFISLSIYMEGFSINLPEKYGSKGITDALFVRKRDSLVFVSVFVGVFLSRSSSLNWMACGNVTQEKFVILRAKIV
jgi:hypothetical protein